MVGRIITFAKTLLTNLPAKSKLANILWTKQLQERYDAKNIPIICISLHPGGVHTGKQFPSVSVSQYIEL